VFISSWNSILELRGFTCHNGNHTVS